MSSSEQSSASNPDFATSASTQWGTGLLGELYGLIVEPPIGQIGDLLVAFDHARQEWFPVLDTYSVQMEDGTIHSCALVMGAPVPTEEVRPPNTDRNEQIVYDPDAGGFLAIVPFHKGTSVTVLYEDKNTEGARLEADGKPFPRLAQHLRFLYDELKTEGY